MLSNGRKTPNPVRFDYQEEKKSILINIVEIITMLMLSAAIILVIVGIVVGFSLMW